MPGNDRFLIADDHELFRRGLRFALLDGFKGADIVEAGTFDQALEQIDAHPGLTLASFDLGMPGMQVGRALLSVRRRHPILPLVVLSGSEDRRTMLAAIEFGASGFIPKSLPADDIVAAFRQVLEGRIFMPPTVIDLDVAPAGHPSSAATKPPASQSDVDLASLTPRQQDVLRRLVAGRSTKEIGRDLDLAEGTVKVHLAAIFRILDARNRIEAVARALSLGLGSGSSIL